MHTKHLLTCAVLSAALLPVSGALAQDSSSTSMSVSDVGEFRSDLHSLRDMFGDMRENSRLAIASPDRMVSSSYEQMNGRLLQDSLGVLDELTINWKRIDTPETNVQQLGSKDMARFAGESQDTAFVRNTVWDLQSRLLAAKLNGRNTNIITDEMISMLDAAIARADNPNFQVASAMSSSSSSHTAIDWGRREETATTSAPEVVAAAPAAREWHEVTIEHENLPAREQVAMADTTTTTTTEVMTAPETTERMGSADLPQTGGDPGLLYMFGSGIAGLGGLLLRKRRA
jgi:LPXTG-motif cell wall-anchored protein